MLLAEDKSADRSDSLLYQIQSMFGFLTSSIRQAYDTSPFCLTYKVRPGILLSCR